MNAYEEYWRMIARLVDQEIETEQARKSIEREKVKQAITEEEREREFVATRERVIVQIFGRIVE